MRKSASDMKTVSGKWAKWIPLSAVLLVALGFPLMTQDPFYLSLIILPLVWSVAVMGFAAVARAGSFSLGQAAFMAIGAYAACLAEKHLGVSFWSGLAIGGIVAALFAVAIGIIVLRIGGIYFSIITLAFGEAVRVVALNWRELTLGPMGIIACNPTPIQIGSFTMDFVSTKLPYYYLIMIILIVAALVFWRLDRSRFGRVSQAMTTSELLSQHVGIHLMKYRVIVFAVAGFFTGVAGSYYVHYTRYLHPAIFGIWESITIAIMGAVGGMASPVAGPIIGSMVVKATGHYLTSLLEGLTPLVYGATVVLILFFLPNGLVQLGDYFRKLVPRSQRFETEGITK